MAKVKSINNIIADRSRAKVFDLLKLANGDRNAVFKILKKLQKSLFEQLAISEIDDSGMTKYQQNKLRGLFANVTGTIETTYRDINEYMGNELIELADLEAKANVKLVNDSLKFRLINNAITREQAKTIASETLIQGASSSEWWSRQSVDTTRQFKDVVRQGVLRGQTLGQLAREIKGVPGIPGVTAPGMGFMTRVTKNAEALVRSSVLTVANETRNQLYKGNEDVVKGWTWLSTLDGRTTPQCLAYSGSSWSLDNEPIEGNTLPFIGLPGTIHWSCRSTAVPLLKSLSEITGIDGLDEMPESSRASMDGQVPGDTTFDEWLTAKDEEDPGFADDMMGAGKAQLWRDGEITLQDLVSDRGSVKTLADLKKEIE